MKLAHSISRLCATVSLGIAGALALAWAPVVQAETLRVCLDPDNLPFSKKDGNVPGMYTELADLVGKKMGVTVERVWWLTYKQKRAMRNTLLKNYCDATFAVPTGKGYRYRTLDRTAPFLNMSFAVVGPTDLKFTQLTDLKGKKIGVQFGTTPGLLIATEGGYDSTTFKTSDEVFAALDKGEVDVAFLWGPVAGYDNHTRYKGKFKITPLAGTDLQGEVSVGVRKDHSGLKSRISNALGELKPEIAKLAEKYHLPSGDAVDLDHLSVTEPGKKSKNKADTKAPTKAKVAAASGHSVAATKAEGTSTAAKGGSKTPAEMAASGRIRFNDACSHCHATDGQSPVRARDLRRIKKRHYDDWLNVARTTINNGLLDYGMPKWKGVLAESQIDELIEFLKTIQQ